MPLSVFINEDQKLLIQWVHGTVRIDDYYAARSSLTPEERQRLLPYKSLLIHDAQAVYELTTQELIPYMHSWNRITEKFRKAEGTQCTVALTDVGYGIARASEQILESLGREPFPTFDSYEKAASYFGMELTALLEALQIMDDQTG